MATKSYACWKTFKTILLKMIVNLHSTASISVITLCTAGAYTESPKNMMLILNHHRTIWNCGNWKYCQIIKEKVMVRNLSNMPKVISYPTKRIHVSIHTDSGKNLGSKKPSMRWKGI